MIQETSKLAYKEIKLGPEQRKLLAHLQVYGDMTDHEIKESIGWEINRVTGRKAIVWGINNNDPQLKMFC